MIWPNSKKIRELAGCTKDISVQKTPASSKASVETERFWEDRFYAVVVRSKHGGEVEDHCLFVHERMFWVVDKMEVCGESLILMRSS